MKKPLLVLCLAFASNAGAAERPDLTLNDGQVLKSARILTIKDEAVTILHAKGVVSVSPEAVPLDVLARAHMELSTTADAKKKGDAEILAKATQQVAENDAKKREEIQVRLAEANARAIAQGDAPVKTPKAPAPDADKKLMALKAQFPAKRKQAVDVHVSGRRRGSSVDKIEIEVPSADVWSYYHGMISTATVQGLPVTLQRIEERMTRDLADINKRGSIKDESANAQARGSVGWINGELRAYLAKVRAVVP
jgi:hypothetical protein